MRKTILVLLMIMIWLAAADMGLKAVLPQNETPLHNKSLTPYQDLFQAARYASLKPLLSAEVETEGGSERFTLETNRFGLRMNEVTLAKPQDRIRIAVMGDEASLGWGLDQEDAYAAQLEAMMSQAGNEHVEVLNFAAPGFTVFHGLKQYERLVHRFDPDLVILAFGLWDTFESRVSEPEFFDILQRHDLARPYDGLAAFLNQYSYLGNQWMSGYRERARLEFESLVQQRTAQGQWRKRVNTETFSRSLEALINDIRQRGGDVILLNLNLLNYHYSSLLTEVAERQQTPFHDLRSLLDGLGGRHERKFAYDRELDATIFEPSENSSQSQLRFRVYVPPEYEVNGPVSIVGDHEALGEGVPNRVRMYDNGAHGDEEAGDRIWTLQVEIPFEQPIHYAFTLGGEEGRWREQKEGFLRQGKNQTLFHRVAPVAWSDAVRWTSIVHIYGRYPFQPYLIESNLPLPNSVTHRSIARRLSHLIEDRVQLQSIETAMP